MTPGVGPGAPSETDPPPGPRHRLSLRLRAVVAFGAVSLLLAGTLAVVAYSVVRSSLIEDRREAAMNEAYLNARAVRTRLRGDGAALGSVLAGLQRDRAGAAFLHIDGRWYASSLTSDASTLPPELVDGVEREGAAGQQISPGMDGMALVAGVPVPEFGATYFQVSPIDDLDRTLGLLGSALLIGAIGAAVVGALAGSVLAGRVMRPLRQFATVAGEIASGRSDARLDVGGDTDLEPLARSFNGMVDELHERIRREARFASDISHDLRGPLVALSSAVAVVNRRRGDLPSEAGVAIDALDEQVTAFNRLVVDLLEISRFEAGTASLDRREVDVLMLVRAIVDEHGDGEAPGPAIRVISREAGRASVDPRRIQQVFANLLENADNYAGGATEIVIDHRPADGVVRISVADEGPGVDEDERATVFERFHRGHVGGAPGAPRGTGLGLALCAEHVKLHGGRLWVEPVRPHGARFVVELPSRPAVDASGVGGAP